MALRINVPDFGVGRVWAGLGGGYVWLWRELKPSGETANAGYAGYAEYAEYAVFRGGTLCLQEFSTASEGVTL